MAFTDKTEKGFETLIVNWLVDQNGYQQGTNEDYNKEYAIDETRLFRFLNDTQPKEMDKLGVNQSDQKKRQPFWRNHPARHYRRAAQWHQSLSG